MLAASASIAQEDLLNLVSSATAPALTISTWHDKTALCKQNKHMQTLSHNKHPSQNSTACPRLWRTVIKHHGGREQAPTCKTWLKASDLIKAAAAQATRPGWPIAVVCSLASCSIRFLPHCKRSGLVTTHDSSMQYARERRTVTDRVDLIWAILCGPLCGQRHGQFNHALSFSFVSTSYRTQYSALPST